jgi:hypothetical protein
MPVQATDASDGQAFTKLAMLADDETADKSRAGSDESEEHWLNIWLAFVQDDIFKSGGRTSPVQLKNICWKFVTPAVVEMLSDWIAAAPDRKLCKLVRLWDRIVARWR